jgi:hypothetical protein
MLIRMNHPASAQIRGELVSMQTRHGANLNGLTMGIVGKNTTDNIELELELTAVKTKKS